MPWSWGLPGSASAGRCCDAGVWSPPLGRPAYGLSAREQEVLRLIAQGLANKAIATSLHLSVHTVERHVVNLLRKVGAGNRTEATAWAHAQGLVD